MPIRCILASAVFAIGVMSAHAADPSIFIAGKWETDFGLTDLNEGGGIVTGSYTHENGKIDGTRSENRLTGRWTQSKAVRKCDNAVNGSYFHGRLIFDFTANEFVGRWGYCDDSPTERWSGSRSLDGKESVPVVASLSPANREARINSLIELARRTGYGSPESNAAWSEAAALGNVYARGLMANRFCNGEFVQKDERRCHSIYLLLAEEGHAQSQEMVGRQYMYGQGTTKDIHAARYWFERAANQGNSASMGLLGNIYDPSENHFPNMDLAIFWKRTAYKHGNDIAYYWLKQRNLLEQSRDEKAFITRIDTKGPDRSNLANFNYEVAVYCQYGGKQCTALRSEGYRLEKEQNARADAANMQRLWNIYRRESEDPSIRTKCLQRATETLHKATYGQQSWYYSANNC